MALQKRESLILLADLLNAVKEYESSPKAFLEKWEALAGEAQKNYHSSSFGSLSQLVIIHDNIWVRVNADQQSSAISPDDNAKDLFPNLFAFAVRIKDKAKQLSIPIILTIAHGEIYYSDDAMVIPINAQSGTPMQMNIPSFGSAQIKCAQFFKNNRDLPHYSIWVDSEIVESLDEKGDLLAIQNLLGTEPVFPEIRKKFCQMDSGN